MDSWEPWHWVPGDEGQHFQPAITNGGYSLFSHDLMPGFKVQLLPQLQVSCFTSRCVSSVTLSPNLSRALLWGLFTFGNVNIQERYWCSIFFFLLLFFLWKLSISSSNTNLCWSSDHCWCRLMTREVDESGMWREGGGVSGCVTASLRN